ncbi:MAG TPA: ABC transporter permease [Alphaproteobacteria bacterium]|nr:ABC transporter permease [Alphaproteobacteria bacterium]
MISEINKSRINAFKANKRGYYSFLIFSLLFIISLFAEFIANDKPAMIVYKDNYYFPVFKAYPETEFGGIFETETDYRDNFVQDEILRSGGKIFWPLIEFRFDTINFELQEEHPAPPNSQNLLGTDDRGRDVLARIIYGFRISVFFGLILTVVSSVIGIIAGVIQGYYGGIIDLTFQRFIEIWDSIPTLFLLIILASIIEPTFWILLCFLLLFSWMRLVGVVRAEVLKVRNFDYVQAAKALGVSERKIMLKHILPNSLVAVITFMPFVLSGSIITLTALDFLGFGLPSGYPSLGEILSQGKANLQAPWLGITGFVVLSVMLSLLIFIGEAARDALSPYKK